MNSPDVIIIGAGAAGLLAASRAAERGFRTLLVEKNRKPGVKILMSGGSRCNLTQNTDPRGIVRAFGDQGPFLHSALAALGPRELVALVELEGVPTKIEPTGKVFPASDKAADVLRALARRLERSGCETQLSRPVTALSREGGQWQVSTPAGNLYTRNVIVAAGGRSYPGCGTTGDAYEWLRQLGHEIVPTRPALVPLTSSASWIGELAGVTVPDVAVAVVPSASPLGEAVSIDARPPTARGSFLFTHRGVSGPAVLNASRGATAYANPGEIRLRCDFLPTISLEQLDRQLRERAARGGKRGTATLLEDLLPSRLLEALWCQAGLPMELRGADLSRGQRQAATSAIKQQVLPVTGSMGYEKAEVTAGGVSLAEVDSRTLRSRLHPGLFLAGEVLDLDGPIGGYNFQAAFSTGWLAAESLESPG